VHRLPQVDTWEAGEAARGALQHAGNGQTIWSTPSIAKPHTPALSFPAPQVLLIENDINTNPFTPAVHACVPPLPWSVTEADVADPSRCVHPATPSCCQNHLAMQPGTRFLPHMCSRPLAAPCSGILTCALHTAQLLSLHQAFNHHPPVPSIRRTDLRHLAVCSVDPPGCKDIDDALHVRRLPNGNFELGVRIFWLLEL